LPSTETRTASSVPCTEPLPIEENVPRDKPTVEVAVADREPEFAAAEVLALTAVTAALVPLAFAVNRTSGVAVTGGAWNELKDGSDGPPPVGVTGSEEEPAREKTERVSEPWLLTRTSRRPLDLARTSIALGSAGVSPVGRSSDATLNPLPRGTKISTTPSARATTTCPLARACAASTGWPEKTTTAPAPGSSRSNRTRSPPV